MSDMNKNPLIDIDMTQMIGCESCTARAYCKLDKINNTCFTMRTKRYQNESFVRKFKWKYLEFFKELQDGKRTVYCASIYDPKSMEGHVYNRDWALENMAYYIENGN